MITERKKIYILSRHQHLSQMNVPATTEPLSSSVFSSLLGTIYLLNSVSSYITQATTAWKGGRNPSYQQTNCKIISWYWEGKRLQRHWRERLWNSNNCTEALGQLSGKKSNTYPGSKRVHKSITILLFIRKHTQPLGFLHFFPFLLSTPIRNTQLGKSLDLDHAGIHYLQSSTYTKCKTQEKHHTCKCTKFTGQFTSFLPNDWEAFYARSVLTKSVLRDVCEFCSKYCSRTRTTTMLERSGHV